MDISCIWNFSSGGTKIQLKIGKLKEEKVFVDSFIKVGMKASDAKKALEDAGFTKVVINGDSNGVVVRNGILQRR